MMDATNSRMVAFRRHACDDNGVNDPVHLALDLAESPFWPCALGDRLLFKALAAAGVESGNGESHGVDDHDSQEEKLGASRE